MHALPALTRETTVGAIVTARPGLARLFEHLGIDYCCRGKLPLEQACAQRGLDPATTLTLLQSAADALGATPVEENAAGMTLTELADHIERTHHAYLKNEMPRLVEMANRVATRHGENDPRLFEVAAATRGLADEMFDHMEKEEIALFPLVRRIENSAGSACACDMLAAPIRQMEIEHDDAGRAISHLRELTDGFSIPDAFCNTHRALLAGLAAFEADLHRHVHKENSILFPRALELAARAPSPTA
ncbi:MAG: iron-sulfur cluster repair di-iron protein [Opitutaceae bacterium]|nr:iron-sulfur cluster repair di-iron protein [Opitutaceae bacterium]